MIHFDVSTLNPEKITGVGVYMLQLLKHFKKMNLAVRPVLKLSRWKNKKDLVQILPQQKVSYVLPWSFYGKCDLYHGPDFKMSTNGNFPRIVTVHDMVVFEEKYNSPEFYKSGIAALTKTLNSENLAGVIVNSEFTKSEVLKHFPHLKEKLHVTYLGCDKDVEKNETRSFERPQKYILYLGTLEKRKNVLGVIECFQRLKAAGLEHDLLLVGSEGFEYCKIERAIQDCAFSQNIRRINYVSDAVAQELYSNADVFFFPSFYEGFGIPVLEAMAAGCPVVTSSGGALEEICGDAALKARPDDLELLTQHIWSLARDSELRKKQVQRGRERAAQFTWEKCAQETLQVYKTILGSL